MGFGHAVYVGEDPRSVLLGRGRGGPLGGGAMPSWPTPPRPRSVTEVLARLKPDRDLRTNVEFYAGVVMERCGIPRELFTPDLRRSAAPSGGAPTPWSRPPPAA